uniref:Uncharacterized protein n=1 Tax=Helianthus annuus TaxID=4232 RepID=A0A251TAT4_HELAN
MMRMTQLFPYYRQQRFQNIVLTYGSVLFMMLKAQYPWRYENGNMLEPSVRAYVKLWMRL